MAAQAGIQLSIDEKNGRIIIDMPLQKPTPSRKTGKTLVIGTTHGNFVSSTKFMDENVSVGVNVYIPNRKFSK